MRLRKKKSRLEARVSKTKRTGLAYARAAIAREKQDSENSNNHSRKEKKKNLCSISSSFVNTKEKIYNLNATMETNR